MRPDDVAAVVGVQEPAAVEGLAAVFPQDRFPFPRVAIARRWLEEIDDPGIDCFVMLRAGTAVGFAAIRGKEVLHFGVALEEWGSGLAVAAHTELVERLGAARLRSPFCASTQRTPAGARSGRSSAGRRRASFRAETCHPTPSCSPTSFVARSIANGPSRTTGWHHPIA